SVPMTCKMEQGERVTARRPYIFPANTLAAAKLQTWPQPAAARHSRGRCCMAKLPSDKTGNFWDAPPSAPDKIDPDKLLAINKSFERKAELDLEKERIKSQRASGAVMPRPADPDSIILEVAMTGASTTKLEYMIDPWLPKK